MATMNNQQLVAMPQQSAPNVITSGDNVQAMMLQAVMQNMKPDQAASLQAALAMQARIAANKYYMRATTRKLSPALTNGSPTQAYTLASPMTFNMTTATNGFMEGIILRVVLNYTLAAGTAAVYGKTAAGLFGSVDSVDVRYNKSQHHCVPRVFKQLGLMGALEDYVLPESVLAGQTNATLQAYLTTDLSTTVGANTAQFEIFIPFCLLGMDNPLGLLPIIVGDTGIQVTVNTPQALFGSDPVQNIFYAVSGTGHAVSAVSGTIQVDAVYRDGDVFMSRDKAPFDMSAVQGTFQMQVDQVLQPLIANSQQRTKLTVMGRHAYVILEVIDGLQSNVTANNTNMTYLELAKDGVGANVFMRFGTQTNLSVSDFFYMKRLHYKQDIDNGYVPLVNGPVAFQGDPHIRNGIDYLDNSPDGWPDFRYTVTLANVGNGTLNGLPCTPRIIPHVFYTNPVGLIPV